MSPSKTKREAGGDTAGTEETPANNKEPRKVVVSGIPYNVVRSYYDPRQNTVIDVYEKTKTVQMRNGEVRDVTLQHHTLCTDEALQAKYRRNTEQVVEVNVDVE